jgi:hypothetical protein
MLQRVAGPLCPVSTTEAVGWCGEPFDVNSHFEVQGATRMSGGCQPFVSPHTTRRPVHTLQLPASLEIINCVSVSEISETASVTGLYTSVKDNAYTFPPTRLPSSSAPPATSYHRRPHACFVSICVIGMCLSLFPSIKIDLYKYSRHIFQRQ